MGLMLLSPRPPSDWLVLSLLKKWSRYACVRWGWISIVPTDLPSNRRSAARHKAVHLVQHQTNVIGIHESRVLSRLFGILVAEGDADHRACFGVHDRTSGKAFSRVGVVDNRALIPASVTARRHEFIQRRHTSLRLPQIAAAAFAIGNHL